MIKGISFAEEKDYNDNLTGYTEKLNALDEEEFQYFIQYHLATCERADLLGASGHLVDILQK